MDVGYTDRSKLMAARFSIDAVQQRTSNAIHVSHRASPRPQWSLFTWTTPSFSLYH